MGATAGATLAALAGREPLLASEPPAPRPKPPTADAVIVLWMAGGMAQTETFDPKRYTPFAPGVNVERGPQHVSGDRHRGRQHQVHAGARADRERDRSRHGDPDVQRRRPRLHPALAAPVSLAHRLHPAAADGDAAPRRGRSRRRSGPKNPDMPAFIAIGQTVEGARRDRHAQGVSHRRVSRRPSTARS